MKPKTEFLVCLPDGTGFKVLAWSVKEARLEIRKRGRFGTPSNHPPKGTRIFEVKARRDCAA